MILDSTVVALTLTVLEAAGQGPQMSDLLHLRAIGSHVGSFVGAHRARGGVEQIEVIGILVKPHVRTLAAMLDTIVERRRSSGSGWARRTIHVSLALDREGLVANRALQDPDGVRSLALGAFLRRNGLRLWDSRGSARIHSLVVTDDDGIVLGLAGIKIAEHASACRDVLTKVERDWFEEV